MKLLHRVDLLCWSQFDEERNIDFNSVLWLRPQGNIVFDPLPLSEHDLEHLLSLGTVSQIFISNSDHCRDAENLSKLTGAELYGPAQESADFPIECQHWVDESTEMVEGLQVFELNGSKTPGELAFVIEGDTLITGDLVRCHQGGTLRLLPDPKLKDKAQALLSVERLAQIDTLVAVIPGDGWPIFSDGYLALTALIRQTAA